MQLLLLIRDTDERVI